MTVATNAAFAAVDFAEGVAAEAGPLTARVVRTLMAADGYLQLGLPGAALKELDGLDEDCGPLTSARDYLVGQALMADDRHEDALEPLQRAAEMIPAPWNRAAHESLSVCFRATGQDALAEITDLFGEDDGVPPGFDPDAAPYECRRGRLLPRHPRRRRRVRLEPRSRPRRGRRRPVRDRRRRNRPPGRPPRTSATPSGVAFAGGFVPAIWDGEDVDEEEEFRDLAAEADALEPGRPAEWDETAFDGGFGTDDTDRPQPPTCR